MSESQFGISIDLNVIAHLGRNLYSSVPAVLAEAVANAWDADATLVEISIDPSQGTIVITDDGIGMSEAECNEKYLKVGRDRRQEDAPLTPRFEREPMGRKGLGKLSLFAIANRVEVRTVDHRTSEKRGFIMDYDKMQQEIGRQRDETGMPTIPLPAIDPDTIVLSAGTELRLSELDRDIKSAHHYLTKRLGRRFTVIDGERFQVCVNGEAISLPNRPHFKEIEYLWLVGEDPANPYQAYAGLVQDARVKKLTESVAELTGGLNEDGEPIEVKPGWTVSGWIGTYRDQGAITSPDEDNAIVVYARGKSQQDDILKDLHEGGVYTKYVVGEINADFLDVDDERDATTTSRQALHQDDARYVALRAYVSKALKDVQKVWQEWRGEDGLAKARKIGAIDEWLDELTPARRRHAADLFRKIDGMAIAVADRREFYRHAIAAFHTFMAWDALDKLSQIDTPDGLATLFDVFEDLDWAEAVAYGQIVEGRLKILAEFRRLVDTDVKEKLVQRYLSEHLWLIDPAWERATVDTRVEQRVETIFGKINKRLKKSERKGRIDIFYRSVGGAHVIIELKRYSVTPSFGDLTDQLDKYRQAVRKCLQDNFGEENPNIEIVTILGEDIVVAAPDPGQRRAALAALHVTVQTYDGLIQRADRQYKDYREKQQKLGAIRRIIESI